LIYESEKKFPRGLFLAQIVFAHADNRMVTLLLYDNSSIESKVIAILRENEKRTIYMFKEAFSGIFNDFIPYVSVRIDRWQEHYCATNYYRIHPISLSLFLTVELLIFVSIMCVQKSTANRIIVNSAIHGYRQVILYFM